jgi:hypothetical protein
MPWLLWLARQLAEHKQSIFYIERMQPDWLSEKHLRRWYPRLAAGIIFGLPTALGFGLVGGSLVADLYSQINRVPPPFILVLGFIIFFGLVSGSLFGLLNGWLYARETRRRPAHARRWPRRPLSRSIVPGVLNGLLFGLLIGCPLGLVQWDQHGDELPCVISRGILFWLLGAMGFALIDGLLGIEVTEIRPAETFAWSWVRMWRNLVKYAFLGLLASLLIALLVGLLLTLYIWVTVSNEYLLSALSYVWHIALLILLLTASLLTLTSGLLGGLVGGLSSEVMDVRNLTTPNLGIRRSARHGLLVGGAVGLLGFLMVVGVFFAAKAILPLTPLSTRLSYGLIVGVLTGLISGLRSGGIACFEHLALHWLLWKDGSVPWKYAHFLDYAAERILLRKVGGGYIFTHRLLLEYFATLATTPRSESAVDPEQDEMHR